MGDGWWVVGTGRITPRLKIFYLIFHSIYLSELLLFWVCVRGRKNRPSSEHHQWQPIIGEEPSHPLLLKQQRTWLRSHIAFGSKFGLGSWLGC